MENNPRQTKPSQPIDSIQEAKVNLIRSGPGSAFISSSWRLVYSLWIEVTNWFLNRLDLNFVSVESSFFSNVCHPIDRFICDFLFHPPLTSCQVEFWLFSCFFFPHRNYCGLFRWGRSMIFNISCVVFFFYPFFQPKFLFFLFLLFSFFSSICFVVFVVIPFKLSWLNTIWPLALTDWE